MVPRSIITLVNGLALNTDKSEAIWFSTWQRSVSLPPVSSVNIAGSTIPISSSIKTLGVTLGTYLPLNQHVFSVCKFSYFHLSALRHIRSVLTEDMAKSIAVALVTSGGGGGGGGGDWWCCCFSFLSS